MASYEFRLPDIGEGIAEAEIVSWHAAVGDFIEEDQPLVDMMTDKATVEMTSPVSGRIVRLAGKAGDKLAIGSVLASFAIDGEEGEIADAPHEPAVKAAPVVTAAEPSPSVPPAPVSAATPSAEALPAVPVEVPARERSREGGSDGLQDGRREHAPVLASPSVRKRARDLGIDLAHVKAEGPRVRHGDLDAFIAYHASYAPAAGGPARADERVRVIGLRRRIAENMAASKRHIPHFTYVEEIDVTRLEEMRAELNDGRKDRPRLTILPLLITAFCKALPEFPMINARYDDEAGVVTRYGAVHLGVAAQTPQGLLVPVVRNAQSLNIWQLATEIARLADAARSGTARAEELSGSTVTVTSLGALGGVASTPVINRPEVAILGPNKVVERPVFRGREVVAAKLMNLSISCDHRVVDGWDAASYVQQVKTLVEAPSLLFAP